jgi:hypothetical protein
MLIYRLCLVSVIDCIFARALCRRNPLDWLCAEHSLAHLPIDLTHHPVSWSQQPRPVVAEELLEPGAVGRSRRHLERPDLDGPAAVFQVGLTWPELLQRLRPTLEGLGDGIVQRVHPLGLGRVGHHVLDCPALEVPQPPGGPLGVTPAQPEGDRLLGECQPCTARSPSHVLLVAVREPLEW